MPVHKDSPTSPRNIVVIGAGIIGVTTAYLLAREGHSVTVVEREDGPGLETSFANGGQLSAGEAAPWAGPGVPLQALKWLGRTDAPLRLRLKADPDQWRWLWRFWRRCNLTAQRDGAARNAQLAMLSRTAMAVNLEELQAHGMAIDYDRRDEGIAMQPGAVHEGAGGDHIPAHGRDPQLARCHGLPGQRLCSMVLPLPG